MGWPTSQGGWDLVHYTTRAVGACSSVTMAGVGAQPCLLHGGWGEVTLFYGFGGGLAFDPSLATLEVGVAN